MLMITIYIVSSKLLYLRLLNIRRNWIFRRETNYENNFHVVLLNIMWTIMYFVSFKYTDFIIINKKGTEYLEEIQIAREIMLSSHLILH